MVGLEDILCELSREEINEQGLPPGFRFHPTDEELVTFYLASKVFNGSFCSGGVHIAQIDLNRCEPWDLPEVARMGEKEWYFLSLRDRKYPTGLRTNRATGAGYWKATGKDREVYGGGGGFVIGMKKTLVFYKGRAPRGHKTRWVMHEYRLDGHFSCRHTSKEEWVMCRIVHKYGGGGGGAGGVHQQQQKTMLGDDEILHQNAFRQHDKNNTSSSSEECINNPLLPTLCDPTFDQSDFNSLIPPAKQQTTAFNNRCMEFSTSDSFGFSNAMRMMMMVIDSPPPLPFDRQIVFPLESSWPPPSSLQHP